MAQDRRCHLSGHGGGFRVTPGVCVAIEERRVSTTSSLQEQHEASVVSRRGLASGRRARVLSRDLWPLCASRARYGCSRMLSTKTRPQVESLQADLQQTVTTCHSLRESNGQLARERRRVTRAYRGSARLARERERERARARSLRVCVFRESR